jgi:hypothetical protein
MASGYRRPIVGVIIGNKPVRTFGMQALTKANKKAKTTLNFFTTKDINYRRRTVRGVIFNLRNKRWERKVFPFPDVLYVRGGSSGPVRRAVNRLSKKGITKVNPVVRFNKGEVFRKLKQIKQMRPYLPYTKTIQRLRKLRRYIRNLGKVYIKATYGRKGTKVMRVVKLSEGYTYSYSYYTRLVRKRVRHFKNLKKVMKSFFRRREVIVQEAIDLFKVGNNRPVDFRAELQRNGRERLKIMGVSMRIGQSNSPITTHGRAYKMEGRLKKLLPRYSEQQINELKDKIKVFLKRVYRSVEKIYGKFGELGIDFAVDRHGKIWLIETNAQSAKVSIGKAYGPRTVKKIYLNPLEYTKTIARRKK